LIGKQLLPLLGGTPSVWNVCLLFFQCALLAGYGLAHGVARLAPRIFQYLTLIVILAAAAATLPVSFDDSPDPGRSPTVWLGAQLVVQAGLPFLALAAAGPLVQHWYGQTERARDPYTLYAASNAGSLTALLAFPFFLEPTWSIHQQNRLWVYGFAFAILLAIGAASLLKHRVSPTALPTEPIRLVPWPVQMRWLALSFVPSSLLLGVTSYLTTDLASVPLLWIVPLALYLLTFIVAFGPAREGPSAFAVRLAVLIAVSWAAVYRLQPTEPLWLLLAVHLTFFAGVSLLCHSRLAALRPPPEQLTRFYLMIATGGALGGAFNALVAPLVFPGFVEYPLMAIAALLLGLPGDHQRLSGRRDLLPALALTALAFALLRVAPVKSGLAALVTVGLPLLIAFVLSNQPQRFALALAAVLLTLPVDRRISERVVHRERNFFGVLRVTTDGLGRYRELRHGSTLHGAIDRSQREGGRPLTYYSYRSPGTDILRGIQERRDPSIAVVGLGVGSLAWYARPGESWTFFEINPAVVRMAQDSGLFGFLGRSRAGSLGIRLGDARRQLNLLPDRVFDLLVLDAFNSDAIPLHLLTREAIELYLRKLKADGVLAVHISNRHLDLAPVLADLAATTSLRIRARGDLQLSAAERTARIEPSHWVALARRDTDFGQSLFAGTWYVPAGAGGSPWTDDYSNLWSALVW
jgi:hypothetical protein